MLAAELGQGLEQEVAREQVQVQEREQEQEQLPPLAHQASMPHSNGL